MRSRIIMMLVALLYVVAVACSSDNSGDSSNDDNSNNTNSADQISEDMEQGTWRITYFFDTDTDETSDFSGYSFKFNADGTLVATKGGDTVEGTWSVVDDSSNDSNDDDGNSSDDDDFNIFFPVPADSDFEDLNDDWDIITHSSSKIELTDVSGGNGGTDFLTFEKN